MPLPRLNLVIKTDSLFPHRCSPYSGHLATSLNLQPDTPIPLSAKNRPNLRDLAGPSFNGGLTSAAS